MVAETETDASPGTAGQPGFGELAADAEAVRAYLVSVRGGAPFLSSVDARLLHDWLGSGVRVGLIARAIDGVNRKRLAQRVRAPLSLASCRAEVGRLRRNPGTVPRPRRREAPPPDHEPQPAHEAAGALVLPLPASVEALYAQARAEALAVSADSLARLDHACGVGRRFFDEAWDLLDRPAWIEAAAAELAPNRDLYTDGEWAACCEAWARESMRRRYPGLTATCLWEELGCGVE